jgi:hypothetical protein
MVQATQVPITSRRTLLTGAAAAAALFPRLPLPRRLAAMRLWSPRAGAHRHLGDREIDLQAL